MTATPDFVAQTAGSLTAIRYYTPQDPYTSDIDNRPLTDIAENLTSISSGGGDSARRAVLMTELALAGLFKEVFASAATGTVMASGLGVTLSSATTIQVSQGALYYADPVSDSNTEQIVKQALFLTPQSFNVPAPGASGQAINYLIEYQILDMSSANMANTALPYLDSANTWLPSLLLNKELKLQIVTGTPNTTGLQATPGVTSGWSSLFVITSVNGQAAPTVGLAPDSPNWSSKLSDLRPQLFSSGSPTYTNVAGVPTLTFAKTATQTVSLPISLAKMNPYKPMKFLLTFSSDTAGGNFGIQSSYNYIPVSSSTAAGLTSTAVESVPLTVGANVLTQYTTTVAIIPQTVFAGFNNSVWSTNSGFLSVTLQRLPSTASDTNSGNLYLHSINISQ